MHTCSKKRILIVEPMLRNPLEFPWFIILDILTNMNNICKISIPFHVHTNAWWKKAFADLHLDVVEERPVGVLPDWFPIGKTRLYVLEKWEDARTIAKK